MNIDEIIAQNLPGKTAADIVKIYHGRDHECRCGCRGKYFHRGERGFTRARNRLDKLSVVAKGTFMGQNGFGNYYSGGIESDGKSYVNLPYDAAKDKCYTLYFD